MKISLILLIFAATIGLTSLVVAAPRISPQQTECPRAADCMKQVSAAPCPLNADCVKNCSDCSQTAGCGEPSARQAPCGVDPADCPERKGSCQAQQ